MIHLQGERYVVFGVANEKSICWAITRQLQNCGAEVILCCQPNLKGRVEQRLAKPAGIKHVYECDVTDDASIEACFVELRKQAPLSGVVHGIAFSDKNELRGPFIKTSRENFAMTMDISCYSFIKIARGMEELMPNGGSMITLTFDAWERIYPNYNVMGLAKAALETATRALAVDLGEFGICVNAISASPEDTLSARGIDHFRLIGAYAEAQSPIGRRATIEEIANVAVFFLSGASSGITGQILFVDCGSSITAMPPPRNAAKMRDAMDGVAKVYQKQQLQG